MRPTPRNIVVISIEEPDKFWSHPKNRPGSRVLFKVDDSPSDVSFDALLSHEGCLVLAGAGLDIPHVANVAGLEFVIVPEQEDGRFFASLEGFDDLLRPI